MMRPCARCGRRVCTWPWQQPLCGDSQFWNCVGIEQTSSEGFVPVEEPPPFPDDLPPEDIGVCSSCVGIGEVPVRQDWETGAIEFDICRACRGSGKDRSWLPV